MNEKRYLKLQSSEATVIRAAADIYAGYLAAGRVEAGQEDDYLRRSIKDAIRIAEAVDAQIVSDNETH